MSRVATEKHHCDKPSESENLDFGNAVSECWVRVDGKMFVGNGEYANQVNYCPFCGKRAKTVIGSTGVK